MSDVAIALFAYLAVAGSAGFGVSLWSIDHSQTPADDQPFYLRHRVVVSVFWPVTVLLLAADAVGDYRRTKKRKEIVESHVLEAQFRKANAALDRQIQKAIRDES